FLRTAGRGREARVAESEVADSLVPAQPDDHVRGPCVLRESRRLRARPAADGRPRPRVRRLRVRRLRATVVPRDSGGEGDRRRDLLDVEVVQYGWLAARLRV